MQLGDETADETILAYVNEKLARTGVGLQNEITATISSGNVTLTGLLKFGLHRRAIVRTVASVEGVCSVTDHLKVQLQKKKR